MNTKFEAIIKISDDYGFEASDEQIKQTIKAQIEDRVCSDMNLEYIFKIKHIDDDK